MTGVTLLVAPGQAEATAATRESFDVMAGPEDRWVEADWMNGPGVDTPFALLLRAGDRLEPGALRVVSDYAVERGADLVTVDHRLEGRARRAPRWMPQLLAQLPVSGRVALLSAELLERVRALGPVLSQWDLLVRAADLAEHPEHCPAVLVEQAGPTTTGSVHERLETVRAHLRRTGEDALVVPTSAGGVVTRARPGWTRSVGVVVPTAFASRTIEDGTEHVLVHLLLEALARTVGPSLLDLDAEIDVEVVLVVDAACPQDLLDRCSEAWPGRLRVVRTEGDFNYARAVNAGALATGAEVLLLLNDDVEPLEAGWLQEMLGALGRPGTAAVGARLLLGDRRRLQHIGTVCPPEGLPMHARIFELDDPTHPMAQADVDYLAVTGACLACRRQDFLSVGGMDESLPLNFNDVDLCLKLGVDHGRVVCVNAARLIHRESSTRQVRITPEEEASLDRWRGVVLRDPHVEYWG